MAGNSQRLLIRGGQVYDHDGDAHKPPLADILIEGGNILAAGRDLPSEGVQAILDARDRLIVPGLINAHYHSHDTLCRGMFEELPLEMWLLYTVPMGANRSKEEVRARTLVGAIESLHCGITTLQDLALVKKTVAETGRIYAILYSERLEVRAAVHAGELIRQGAIGKVIQTINIAPHQVIQHPGDNGGGAPRPGWFWEDVQYGGILCDIGSHQARHAA